MIHDILSHLSVLGIIGIDDAIIAAIISSMIGAGAKAATPQYGMTTPETGMIPKAGGAVDFNQLVGQAGGQGQQGQQQPQLPRLQLQDRLPKPPDPFAFQAPTGY